MTATGRGTGDRLKGVSLGSAGAILVVGLSQARRATNVALLMQAGHMVVTAATAAEALCHIAAEAPPLVILDHDVADLSEGAAFCHRIKQESADTFILQIALSVAEEGGAEIESCIDAYLVDPIEPREMLVLVRSLLRLQKVEADLRDSQDRLMLAQESAGLAILDWVIPTHSFIHSDNLLALFDLDALKPGDAIEPERLVERIHPDDLGGLLADFQTGGNAARDFDKEFRIIRRDGEIRWISSRGRLFSGPTGSLERMLSLSLDVTAGKNAEAQRKAAERSNAELASIVASSVDAIVSIDLEGKITSWNAGASQLFGVDAGAMIGSPLGLVFADMSTEERAAYLRLLTDGNPHELETKQTFDDAEPVDLWITSAPMRAPNGPLIGTSLIMRNVSAQKKREDHVRFLMRELTHRSKNLLAVIQAMARQSMTRDITPEDFIKRFTERLAGLAGSHDLLSSLDWKGASLMDLIRSQLNHYLELFDTRIKLDGHDVLIRPIAAQNIGIALHELSTNAAKYGALSSEDGVVTISWSFSSGAGSMLTMVWRESGGPPVIVPTREGFGRIVVDRIAGRALGGKSAISFAKEGVAWTLEAPASAVLID